MSSPLRYRDATSDKNATGANEAPVLQPTLRSDSISGKFCSKNETTARRFYSHLGAKCCFLLGNCALLDVNRQCIVERRCNSSFQQPRSTIAATFEDHDASPCRRHHYDCHSCIFQS
mmetsp:Transcript_16261/g.24104  ORF Transcript_16261/g.24104 Transcript_16261/m.24104 type:complete len:117 (-) Transcript_16261:203-553(-)